MPADPLRSGPEPHTRRTFLRRSAAAAALAAAPLSLARSAHAAGSDEIKIALIGCGAGTGAAAQALSTAGPVKLWAMADAFEDRLQLSLKGLAQGVSGRYDTPANQGFAKQIDVPPERQFVGLDAFQKAIDCGVDVVLLAGPPGFRPSHFQYAVQAGKHVFMEKPLAVDAPGVRQILAAGKEAQTKNLKVGVGLQRHHQPSYVETVKRIQDGAVGRIIYSKAYWVGGPPAKQPPERGSMTEMQYQLRNWYFFTWLSGDHILEQHIHNLDVCNWVMNAHPVQAQGQGGRQARTGKGYGHIFDHHFVEFTYPDGSRMFSQCRQTAGCWNSVSELIVGSEGTADPSGVIEALGKEPWRSASAVSKRAAKRQPGVNPYQIEHDVLFDAIRNNKPHNEVEQAALSTMTGVLGRMATYSGQSVTWDQAFGSSVAMFPTRLAWDADPPILPDADGNYPAAIPGVTRVL